MDMRLFLASAAMTLHRPALSLPAVMPMIAPKNVGQADCA